MGAFLQKRSMNKDTALAMGQFLFLPCGLGEYYYDAAIRELGEEIGLYDPKEFSLLFIDRPRPETGPSMFTFSMLCRSSPFDSINQKYLKESGHADSQRVVDLALEILLGLCLFMKRF